MSSSQVNLAIASSRGITGLIAAAEADEAGIKGIHVFNRKSAGIIHARELAGKPVEMAAEFVDKRHAAVTKWVEKLGLKLIPAQEQDTQAFQLPSGKVLPEKTFLAAYAPIARQIMKDREEALHDPAKKAQMDNLPLSAYMQHLASTVERISNRSWFKRIYDFVTFNNNRVDPDIIQTAMATYASEAGLPAHKISSLYFAYETSPDPENFLKSGCDQRIEGGTAAFIKKLEAYLKDPKRGITFHDGADLQAVAKNGDGLDMNFIGADGKEQHITTKQSLLAIPDYEVAKVKGMGDLGLSPESLAAMGNAEGTHWAKFTVTLTPEAQKQLPLLNFFGQGFQAWQPEAGKLTFLCDSSAVHEGRAKPSDIIQSLLSQYARGNGMSIKTMVDQDQGMVSYFPNAAKPCSATGGIGHITRSRMISNDLEKLAANNITVANSARPEREADGTESYGFMNNGGHSAQAGIATLVAQARMQELARSQTVGVAAPEVAAQHGFHTNRVTQTQPNNKGIGLI